MCTRLQQHIFAVRFWAIPIVIMWSSAPAYAAVAPDSNRTFTHPAENGSGSGADKFLSLATGSYTFRTDADPNAHHVVDWYNSYTGGSPVESEHFYYYDDHDFSFPSGGNYWVRAEVYSSNLAGTKGEWEAVYRWYITASIPDTTPPSVPALQTPENGSTTSNQTPYFNWTNSSDSGSGVSHYEIEIYDGDWTWGDISATPSSSNYTPSSNIPHDRIYWKVRAVDNAGNKSAYTSEWWFDLVALPGTPSNPTPSNGATLSASPSKLDWSNTSDATSYDVYLNGSKVGSNLSSSEWTLNQTLLPGITHTWYVVAKNAAGSTTGPTWSFTISNPLGGIQATLKNQNGVNSTANKTRFILYPGTVQTTGSNPETYSDLTPGGGYWVEGYQNGPLGDWEYWGSESVTVTANQTTPVVINRKTPYCEDFWFEYNGKRLNPDDVVPPGATLTPKAMVRNKDTTGRSSYVIIGWRYGTSGSAIGTRQSSTVTIATNSVITYTLPTVTLTDGTEGDLYAYIKTNGMFSNWALTDTWDWTKIGKSEHFDAAKIIDGGFVVPKGEKEPGTQQEVSVTIQNTGSRARKFWIGLSFEGPNAEEWPGRGWWDIPPVQVPIDGDLAPGGTATVTFPVFLPEWMPDGQYIAYGAVWNGFIDGLQEYTANGGQKYHVAGLMVGNPVDPFDKNIDSTFIIQPSSLTDRYNLGGNDPGGLYAEIPDRYKNANLINIPYNKINTLMDVNQQPLSESTPNVVVLFHGWMGPVSQEHYNTGNFLTLKNNLSTALPSNWRLVPYDWGEDSDTGFLALRKLYGFGVESEGPALQGNIKADSVRVVYAKDGVTIQDFGATAVLLGLTYLATEYAEQQIAANSTVAAYRSYMHGLVLGERLCSNIGINQLKKVHIISHSAGAWGTYAALRYLRHNAPDVQVQVTFLDPFVPANILSKVDNFAEFFQIWESGAKFDESTLNGAKNYANAQNAFGADCYWSFNDEIYWGAELLHNLNDLIAKGFGPVVNSINSLISPKLEVATIMHWTWSGSALTYRTDPLSDLTTYWGHGGPIKYYAESVATPDGPTFYGKGWQKSLAANSLVGSLRAVVSPQAAINVGAQWRRVGTSTWRNSGYTESEIDVGSHIIEFKSVTGWITPANQNVTINNGQITNASGTYMPQTGSLRVTINPQGAIDTGAQWRRVGTSTWRNSGYTESGITVGAHTVEFMAVTGWSTPSNQGVTINNGQTTNASGTYTQQTGSLHVIISPQGAIDAGAQWRRVGTSTWRNSGYTEAGILVGSQTVEFKAMTGWDTPSNQGVTINNGQTTNASGSYTQQTGSLEVTISPQGAIDAGARWRRVGTTTWRNSGYTESGIPVSLQTVEFKAVTGWNNPANENVTINEGETTNAGATYTPATGSLQVTISPQEVIDAGAEWRRVGTETWRNSGDTESNLAVSEHQVEFSPVIGWIVPQSQTVSVSAGETASLDGKYTMLIDVTSLENPMASDTGTTMSVTWKAYIVIAGTSYYIALVNEDGSDSPIVVSSDLWEPDTVTERKWVIEIPADTPSGEYRVMVGSCWLRDHPEQRPGGIYYGESEAILTVNGRNAVEPTAWLLYK